MYMHLLANALQYDDNLVATLGPVGHAIQWNVIDCHDFVYSTKSRGQSFSHSAEQSLISEQAVC